jgi:Protein kinase domain
VSAAPGTNLNGGRYRLLRKLGKGGMGNVWLADDLTLDRQVALKELVLAPNGEQPSVRMRRALREAQAAGRIEHPCIVDIHDVFVEQDHPWIVMSYIKGRTLTDLVEQGHVLSERTIARIFLRVLGALTAAHRADVLHRDVKPDNIIISDAGKVVLVDFGIAHIGGRSSLTSNNTLLGTVDFMAPERVAGKAPGPAADLWSLGITLFWVLERESPFQRDAYLATMRAIADLETPHLTYPGTLAAIVTRLLDKDPVRRMTADQLAPVLKAIIDGPPPERVRPPDATVHEDRTGPEATAAPAVPALTGLPPDRLRDALARLDATTAAVDVRALPAHQVALILEAASAKTAGTLLTAMAIEPAETASLLLTLPAAHAGRALDYADVTAASAWLPSMEPGAAAGILAHCHARTAAAIVGRLPEISYVLRLVEAMSLRRACRVLDLVRPTLVANLLAASTDGRAAQLFDGLSRPVRTQVGRYLGADAAVHRTD